MKIRRLFGTSWLDDIVKPAMKIMGQERVFIGPLIIDLTRKMPRKIDVPYSKRTLLKAVAENQVRGRSWYLVHSYGFSPHQLLTWGLLTPLLESQNDFFLKETVEEGMNSSLCDTPLLIDLKPRFTNRTWVEQEECIARQKNLIRAPSTIVVEALRLVRHFQKVEPFAGEHHGGRVCNHKLEYQAGITGTGLANYDLVPRPLRVRHVGDGKFSCMAMPFMDDLRRPDLGVCVIWKPE